MELRRCQDIVVADVGPAKLEARVTSLRWKPPRLIRAALGSLPHARTVRRLLNIFGKHHVLDVLYTPATLRGRARLVIGAEEVPPTSVEAVALLGWQEEIGTQRVWDITLLGANLDVVVGHKSYVVTHNLAEMLARLLEVPLRESSVVGGSAEYQAPKSSMSRDIFWGVKGQK